MVDETKDPADASNNSHTNADTSGIPEPVILEEIIVGPAKKTEAPKPPAAPAPAVSASPAPKPTPTPPPAPPQQALHIEAPSPIMPPQSPTAIPAAPVQKAATPVVPPAPQPIVQKPIPSIPVPPPLPPVQKGAQPIPTSPSTPAFARPEPASTWQRPVEKPLTPPTPFPPKVPDGPKELGSDIAQILKDIKLPERRGEDVKKPEQPKEPKKFDTSLGSMLDMPLPETPAVPPTPTQPPAPASPQVPQPLPPIEPPVQNTPVAKASEQKSSVVAFHTLKDDLQHVVRDQKISVVRAVSLEQDRKHRAEGTKNGTPDNFSASTPGEAQRSKRTFGVLFSILLLLALGGAALGGVYLIAQQRAGSTPAPEMQSLLFAESTVGLPVGGKSPADLKRILGGARTSASGTLGSITRIVPTVAEVAPDGSATTRAATLEEFLKAIGSGAPDDLLRAAGQEYFFGIHTVDKNAPILILSITSYDRAFAAMLAWEPLMNANLAPIVTPLSAQTLDASGLPTLRAFQDVIMRNYDARALKDDAGEVQLYYSFPTQNILIIAESPYSFAEVLSRLQAERRL